jgi:hypothetical protein
MWMERGSLSLAGSGYQHLADAIDQHAEGVYSHHWRNGRQSDEPRSATEQHLLMDMLLDMVTVGEAAESNRAARVPRRFAAVSRSDEQRTALLRELIDARLLTSRRDEAADGAETITIIHETLLFRWGKLSQAIPARYEWLRKRALRGAVPALARYPGRARTAGAQPDRRG